jgi:hypothetical protein
VAFNDRIFPKARLIYAVIISVVIRRQLACKIISVVAVANVCVYIAKGWGGISVKIQGIGIGCKLVDLVAAYFPYFVERHAGNAVAGGIGGIERPWPEIIA